MKSLYAADNEEGTYSDLQVLKSNAGYYIGTIFTHNGKEMPEGFTEPGSRDSGYFLKKEKAEEFLEMVSKMDEKLVSQYLRDHP